MIIEISIFVFVFAALLLKMKNKREWLYNIRKNRRTNWRKKWRWIPTTKLVFVLFVLLLLTAVLTSFFTFELNYLVWNFFFILHISLYLLAGASLYLFIWLLGGRAMRTGGKVGRLSKVEGTEPTGKKKEKGETFAEGMVRSFFDTMLGKSGKRKKKKRD